MLILTIILLPLISSACSCTGPDVFVKSVNRLILEVEVIGIKTMPKTSTPSKYDYTATVFLVDSVVKGEYNKDTLYVLNDKGFECFHTIKDKTPGKQYILTGSILMEWDYLQHQIPKDTLFGQLMTLHLCSENIVFLYNNKIRGNITKNVYNRKRKRVDRLKVISNKWHEKSLSKMLESNPEEKYAQSMSKERLYAILRRKKLIDMD